MRNAKGEFLNHISDRELLCAQIYQGVSPFYSINEGIYFDSDESIKREKLLNKLGI